MSQSKSFSSLRIPGFASHPIFRAAVLVVTTLLCAPMILTVPSVTVAGEHISGTATPDSVWETLSREYIKNRTVPEGTANLAAWLSTIFGSSGSNGIIETLHPNAADVQRLRKAENNLSHHVRRSAGSRALPQLALGIYRDATPIFTENQGFDSRTVRPLASVTKTFTAVAVLQLMERGKLRLDDPISKYIPELPYAKQPLGDVPVTVRHLLRHTSGVPYGTSRPGVSIESRHRKFSYYIPGQYRPAGVGFAYSNYNYYALALLIERLSGLAYNEYIEQNIFERAGMSDARVSAAANGASGVSSSVRDLSLFGAAVFVRNNPVRLLSRRAVEEMLSAPVHMQGNNDPYRMYYGLGVRVQYADGNISEVYHTGIWMGIFAELRYFPTEDSLLLHVGNPPNYRAARLGDYRAGSVKLAGDYVKLLDRLIANTSVDLPANEQALR